ncbi:hypothetical protein NM74_05080 [Aeromonas hydrophila]|nr:hypothetical protein NM74_05080 [Aeromonas hydrophila]
MSKFVAFHLSLSTQRRNKINFVASFFGYGGQAAGKQEGLMDERTHLFAAGSRPQTGGGDQWRA